MTNNLHKYLNFQQDYAIQQYFIFIILLLLLLPLILCKCMRRK